MKIQIIAGTAYVQDRNEAEVQVWNYDFEDGPDTAGEVRVDENGDHYLSIPVVDVSAPARVVRPSQE